MSEDPCKVLINQIKSLKEYMTGLRQLIGVLSDLAARRATIANVSSYVRSVSYNILTVAGAIQGVAGLFGKNMLHKILGALAGLGGVTGMMTDRIREDTYLKDKDYRKVQRMIDDASKEFMNADRRIRELRQEYRELGCRVKYGNAP